MNAFKDKVTIYTRKFHMPVYILCCNVCCMCEQVIHESNKSMIYIHKHPERLFINAGSRRDYQSTEDGNRCLSTKRRICAVL